MEFPLPESVRAYFEDFPVEAGVDALLSKPDKFPSDVQWGELNDYYRAWIAAQRVRADYAIVLNDLWKALWEPALSASDWVPKSPDNQIEYDPESSPHVANCWRHDWFARCFGRDGAVLYTCTSLSRDGADIGFGLFNRREANMLKSAIQGFAGAPDSDIYWMIEPMPMMSNGALNLDAGPGVCASVLRAAESAIGGGALRRR